MDFVKISIEDAARAFEASGRKARSLAASRAMFEARKGGFAVKTAACAFAESGQTMQDALNGFVDVSSMTLSLYVSGDGEYACRAATKAADEIEAKAKALQDEAEAILAAGDKADRKFEEADKAQRAARAAAIVEALVHGARDALADKRRHDSVEMD